MDIAQTSHPPKSIIVERCVCRILRLRSASTGKISATACWFLVPTEQRVIESPGSQVIWSEGMPRY
jgi:hypothetical protein